MDWGIVSRHLDTLLDQPPERRQACARELAGGDEALFQALLSMLAGVEEADGFLDSPFAPSAQSEGDAPAGVLPEGRRLGAWEIVRLLGRGGMGEVYLARRADGGFEQEAALKTLGPLEADGVQLFEQERQTIARLEHPGIARLLDGGIDEDGRPFMVVERVSGHPVDAWCEAHETSPQAKIGLILDVCDCVAYAHARLVAHRDIKPANILVDEAGRVRLIDFGVSAALESRESRPLTRGYAAPETVSTGEAGTAADIYALAASLFELLTGEPPAEIGASALSFAAWSAQGAPVRSLEEMSRGRALPGPLRADLSAILGKALHADPAQRYLSVDAFAADLRRALAHEPVRARADTLIYRTGRFLWRNAAASLAVTGLVLALAGGLGASVWQQAQIRAERDSVVREQTRLASVQDYLFFMLRDAAAMEGEGDIRSVIDQAAERMSERLAEDPETGGRVLHALSELYFHVNDYEAAEPLLRRLVAMEELPPDLRASAAYDLAQVSLRRGEPELARTQLDVAQNFWRTDTLQYRRELADSRLVEARLLRDEGRIEDAISLLQTELPEMIALNGPDFRETGVFHNDLGVMLMSAGQLEPAAEQLARAREIWRLNDLGDGPDALNTLNNLAAAEFLLGRPERAAPVFAEAVEVREALYGPSAALAAVLGNYGKSLIALSQFEDAVAVLSRARSMALEFAGAGSLHFAASSSSYMEALIAAGQVEQAVAVFAADEVYVSESEARGSPAQAAFDVGAARVLAETGQLVQASERLGRAETIFASLGPAGARYLAVIASLREQYGLSESAPSVPGAATHEP
ncbi:protein kinase [Oceanicaulis sp. LC35]|uniref:serine/threonine protein kinase n=1 Tax=Oceanicaulis sp. LC35 TaxID=3349635 RepID=UPI003F867EEB